MAEFVHITTSRTARGIKRSGIAARSHGGVDERGVYCMPVLQSFTLTYQWTRELRRWHPGVLVAVHLRLPDDEPVTVGRYGAAPRRVSAAQATAIVRELDDPRGYEVFVPRAVTSAEVWRIRDIPQGVGWRYLPSAHDRRPCACPVCTPTRMSATPSKMSYGHTVVAPRAGSSNGYSSSVPRRRSPETASEQRLAAA